MFQSLQLPACDFHPTMPLSSISWQTPRGASGAGSSMWLSYGDIMWMWRPPFKFDLRMVHRCWPSRDVSVDLKLPSLEALTTLRPGDTMCSDWSCRMSAGLYELVGCWRSDHWDQVHRWSGRHAVNKRWYQVWSNNHRPCQNMLRFLKLHYTPSFF